MKVVAQQSPPILVRKDRSYISALTIPTCLGCKEYQDESTASVSDESSTLFTGLETTRTITTNIVRPAMLLRSNSADVAQTINEEEVMDTGTLFPYDKRNNKRRQSNKLSSCTVEDICERFVAFCDPFLTTCVPCASGNNTSSKTISKQNKTRNRVARTRTFSQRRNFKKQHDNQSTAMYNEEEYDRLLSVLRQLGINEHEMTQLLINESDSLQSISRASAAAAAKAATAAATGRISAQHDNNNNNNDRNNCGNNGCGRRGSSYIHTMSSNNDNDNHQSYNNDRILDIGVGDGMLILPPPTNKSVVSYHHCDDDNDRSDPPGENATTAYMEVECFVDTTTAKNSKNMDNNNNNNKRLLPLSLSLKKNDNMTNNNPFDDDDDDDEVDNDDLGTVISCREIVPKQQSFSEKKTMSSLPLDDNNPSKLIRGKSYIVNAETLDLVTLPTDESTKTTHNNMPILNNKSNNNSANDVITSDNLVVEGTSAAIVKRKSLLSSIFSRKKSLKKESSSLESSTSKQSSSSSHEWREFTDVTTGRKYYSNGIMSSWENPALSTPMSNTTSQKIEKKETKKKRSRSTQLSPKSSTITSKPMSSSHLASSSSRSRLRRSKSSPPKQPSASNAPAYSTTTTNNTILETNDDDDDQTLVSKLTFIPDGNVEINDSYFSSIVKGYRLSTQSFHLPPPVQPPHPLSSPPIVYGVATTPSKIRSSSINNTVPLQKGCNMKNAAVNGAAANSSKRKKMTLQVQHQSKPTMMTDEVANVDQSSETRPVIVERGKSFESSDIVPSFHNSTKKAAKVEEQKTDIAVVAKPFSQCNKEAPVVTTETADVAVGRPMENSNIQSSNVETYEHFQFVLTDSSGCDEHTRSAIERNNYNTNNMMIRLPYNPNTTFYDLRCELMEDYPNEIMQLLPNDFKFTISSSSSANGLTISCMQEQKWKVREYYDLSTQSGNGSYKNPYQVYIKSNYINSSKANEIAQHEYDGCW